ncbi:MAG: hypothetical protein HC770_08495 [Pseudanabaena sp. CRU_2_10]|nr:hypothetical protein [Pseudanabaena sp. CRU_2_10]
MVWVSWDLVESVGGSAPRSTLPVKLRGEPRGDCPYDNHMGYESNLGDRSSRLKYYSKEKGCQVPTLSTLPAALFIITIAVLATCVHEFGHAIVAYWGGDTSVKDKGYLTFNPLKYTHPATSIALPLLFVALGGIAITRWSCVY